MMKKVICLVLIVALSLILPPASAHADSSSENLTQAIRPADTFVQPLSEMSESECIEFIKSYGVAIPNIYENESECGSFVKWVITALESDLYRPMAISYTINAEFAENIRSAIIEYYQTTNTVTNYTMDNTLIPKDALDDSSVYGAWDDQFTKYNCYSYVLGYTAAFIDPGLFSAEDPNSYYLKATSKNSFLRIWARDFGSTKVSESPEYFVYWGLFEMNCWAEISAQIAKGVFLEVP